MEPPLAIFVHCVGQRVIKGACEECRASRPMICSLVTLGRTTTTITGWFNSWMTPLVQVSKLQRSPARPLDANNASRLMAALDRQIRPVNVVLIISGMYVNYRDWIQYEIEVAQSYSKPIIGIRPWGSQRVPVAVQSAATEMVGWNTSSIVAAIRRNSI